MSRVTANPRWRSDSAVADDCRIRYAGVLVICVCASNSLDFLSMPGQRKKILFTISILIVVFALYFLNLPGIRVESDEGGLTGNSRGEEGEQEGTTP